MLVICDSWASTFRSSSHISFLSSIYHRTNFLKIRFTRSEIRWKENKWKWKRAVDRLANKRKKGRSRNLDGEAQRKRPATQTIEQTVRAQDVISGGLGKGGASRHVWFSLSALGVRVSAAGAVFSRCHLPAHVRRIHESPSVLNFSACTSSEACSRKLVVSWKSATRRTRTNKCDRIKYPGNRHWQNGLKRLKSYLQ